MKYYTTIISLFFLSSILLSLLIYFGKLSNHIEKDIKKSITKINDLKEQIRINELEYAVHIKTDYLLKLKRIYVTDNIDSIEDKPVLNYINLSDLREKNIHQVFKVSTN